MTDPRRHPSLRESRPRLRPIVALGSWAVVTSLVGCQKSPTNERPKDPVSEPSRAQQAEAHWIFHPLNKAARTDAVRLPGGLLEVDEAGSRWLHQGGAPQVSAFGAPEPLVAVLHVEGRIAAAGRSGTVYVSDEPLGPFTEVRRPEEPFVSTRRAEKKLLSVSLSGAIHRSEDAGLHWKLSDASVHYVELAPTAAGEVLAYAVPERWYISEDTGKTFSRISTPTIAPRQLSLSASGTAIAHGLFDLYSLSSGSLTPLPANDAQRTGTRPNMDEYVLSPSPRASQVRAARAALSGPGYIELEPTPGGRPYKRLSGRLGTSLVVDEARGLEQCHGFVVGFHGRHGAALCPTESPAGVSPILRVLRSTDAGKTFTKLPRIVRGALGGLRIALDSRGRLAVSGLCPGDKPEKGCQPGGVAFIGEKDIEFVHQPGMSIPSAIAFDEEGALWVMGRREKDGHVLVVGPHLGAEKGAKIVDLTRVGGFPSLQSRKEGTQMDLFAADGVVTASLEANDSIYLAPLDSRGRFLGSAEAPAGATRVGGSGRHVIAVDPPGQVLWESTTGGLSWTKESLPRRLCSPRERNCEVQVVCSSAGCIVGDELTRVGWGTGSLADRAGDPLGDLRAANMKRAPGYECQLVGGDWIPLPNLVDIPEAGDALQGDSAWSEVQASYEEKVATAVRARLGRREIESDPLLKSVPDAEDHAFHLLPQVEGSAVVRFRMPTRISSSSSLDLGPPRLPVEVAWDNRIEGMIGHATVQIPVGVSATRFFRNTDPDDAIHLSVAGPGIYVRMTPPDDRASTFYVRGSDKSASVEEIPGLAWPRAPQAMAGWLSDSALSATARSEWVRAEDDHLGLLLFAGSRVVVAASGIENNGAPAQLTPYLMGLLSGDSDGYAQNVSIGYLGKAIGFVSAQINVDGPGHRAAFVRLGATDHFHDPIPVPLQQDIVGVPRPCTERERTDTPRVIAPAQQDVVRPVSIEISPSDVIELAAERAVLFGTPAAPCVGAFDAERLHRGTADKVFYRALVFPGTVSWIFRKESDALGDGSISGRPLECRSSEAGGTQ